MHIISRNKESSITDKYQGQNLELRFEDWDESFNLEEVPKPNLDEPSVGGLGIWLLSEIMDEVTYQTGPDGKNTLTLIKRVP
jgi:anti-sigma regulatory factor (Ser/Thr protein kinase)